MTKSTQDNFIRFFQHFFIAAFFILVMSLFYYQLIKGNYYLSRARNNYVRLIPERSMRGNIYDRNGIVLAQDKASFNVAVIPYQIKDEKNELLRDISSFTGISEKILKRNYNRKFQNLFSPVDIISDVDKQTAFKIKEKFFDEVLIDPKPQRYYPFAYEFCHSLGYVQEAASFDEKIKKYGYAPNERIGLSGVEQYYDDYLRGQDGGDLIEINSQGKIVGFLGKLNAQKGKDIYLTLDSRMQVAASEAIGANPGAIILMDSKNGEVLTIVSSPCFDPNSFVKGKEDVGKFLISTEKPMQNRAIQSTFPLGSTFKPIVSAAALEEKKINTSTTYTCNGKMMVGKAEFECENVHGKQNLYEALTHSCNVYFYNVGIAVGRDVMCRFAQNFGLNSLTGIDLMYEKHGFVPATAWNIGHRWYTGDTLNLSIGQGYIQCSPIEIMLAINVFANGGYLMRPHVLKKIEDTEITLPAGARVPVLQKNLNIINLGLKQVVESESGTARMLMPLNLKIAGKTGTAQANGRPHGWFVGFFPSDAPKYTICVFLENGGSSYEALKVAYKFLENLKEKGLLR